MILKVIQKFDPCVNTQITSFIDPLDWLMVAWRGRLIFFALGGLPALLFDSRQSFWEWSGERLPFASCWRCMEWTVIGLSSLASVVMGTVKGVVYWTESAGGAAVWKGGFITCRVFPQFVTAFKSARPTENTYADNMNTVVKPMLSIISGHPVQLCFFVGNPWPLDSVWI